MATKQNKKQQRRARADRWDCPNCGAPTLTKSVVCSVPCDIFREQGWRFEDDRRHDEIRKRVLDRCELDGCARCKNYRQNHGDPLLYQNFGRDLDVHHLSYKRQGGLGEEEDCVLLCRGCHDKVHAHLKAHGI